MGLSISVGAAHCAPLLIDCREVAGLQQIGQGPDQHYTGCCDNDL